MIDIGRVGIWTFQLDQQPMRRAQEAALAARPYSQRMSAVLSNLAAAMEGREDAPALMTGTGRDASSRASWSGGRGLPR